jgi:ParB/RepB/Spo0J family partition protein
MADTASTQITFQSRGLSIDITDVKVDTEFNTRKSYNNLEELSESILNLGQTTACGVIKKGKKYNLIWGFRRLAALQLLVDAGHDVEVLVDVVKETDANKLVLLNVQENVSRDQLSLVEEFEACKRLSAFMTKEEICSALGVTKTWVTQRLRLDELSTILLGAVDDGLSPRAAQAIQLLPEELHEEFSSRALGQSVSSVTDMVQSRLDQIAGLDPEPVDSDDIELLEDDDDLVPLDEDDDEATVPSDEVLDDDITASTDLRLWFESFEGTLSEDDQERFELYNATIRWSKIPDADVILSMIRLILDEEEESEDTDAEGEA